MDIKDRIKELNDTFKKILEEIPELVFIGDKVLRQKTVEVSFDEGIQISNRLKIALAKYREITGIGRGLAAPQIGENKSVFVAFVDDQFKTYINPKIVKKSEENNLFRESCLSCGYLSVDVKRPRSITIEYTSEAGTTETEEVDGILARLLQHEYDHLEGILNIDKAEPSSIEFMINDPAKEQLRDC